MPGRTFVCEAPGAPADPLKRWWYVQNRAPAMIRRSRRRNGPRWYWECRVCGVLAFVNRPEGQQRALARAERHLATHADFLA